ncbi:MAG: hypothetical protein HYY84_03325 [Deltaproteobacteria bacterium]|nr:hypothetical protein [Deltaproteobacteria bacterium]
MRSTCLLVAVAAAVASCKSGDGGVRVSREGVGYALSLSHAKTAPNQSAAANLRVVGRQGFKINVPYPHTVVEFSTSGGVDVRPTFDARCAVSGARGRGDGGGER